MRRLFSVAIMTFMSQITMAATTIALNDNSDVALTIGQNNYNRLVVKNDKIVEAVFPPKMMSIKRDEQDGSVYLLLMETRPFTLFLTTEAGRHFSVTLTGDESLGKTIELIPQHPRVETSLPVKKVVMPIAAADDLIVSLITHMEQHEPISGMVVNRQYGKAERLKGLLTLVPKEIWLGRDLKGEVIEVYNGSKTSLTLSETWFAKKGIKAIKLSKPVLASKERGVMYRVWEVAHG